MKKPYLNSIEYIRGVSMLGVVAIHVGSQYLINPTPNIHLVALFEIVSRFSVPIFFFLSAFGTFYRLDSNFNYAIFLKRRLKAVLVPYLIWSTFYLFHDNIFYDYNLIPDFDYSLKMYFFGLAKYHLYFLVILIWFYLLMPLWIVIVRKMSCLKVLLLLLAQILFNYWSSYSLELYQFINSLPEDSIAQLCLKWRLNWWVLHYVFVFILGGVLASHSQEFFKWLSSHKKIVNGIFLITLTTFLSHYYCLIYQRNFSTLAAVNTIHQLSPLGILYSISSTMFLFTFFRNKLPTLFRNILNLLGRNSYFVYLAHPLTIFYLSVAFEKTGRIMTASSTVLFYFLTVSITLLIKILFQRFFRAVR